MTTIGIADVSRPIQRVIGESCTGSRSKQIVLIPFAGRKCRTREVRRLISVALGVRSLRQESVRVRRGNASHRSIRPISSVTVVELRSMPARIGSGAQVAEIVKNARTGDPAVCRVQPLSAPALRLV